MAGRPTGYEGRSGGRVRRAAAAPVIALALAAGGCGDEQPRGDPVAGERVVAEHAEPTCGRCHTLSDAGFTGGVAPNLDALRPGYGRVLDALREGPGLMPSYDDELTEQQLHDVAAYVSQATSRLPASGGG